MARVNRNDDVAGEPTTDGLVVRKPAGTVRSATYRSLNLLPAHPHPHPRTLFARETNERAWRAHAPKQANPPLGLPSPSTVKYPCGRLQAGLMELIKMCSINRTAGPPSPTIHPSCSPTSPHPLSIHPLYLSTLFYSDPPYSSTLLLILLFLLLSVLRAGLVDPRTSGAQSNICV